MVLSNGIKQFNINFRKKFELLMNLSKVGYCFNGIKNCKTVYFA